MDYRLHKKKAGITEDNRHAEISTTFPHQAATPKQQMLKWRHHSTKWSTESNADDRLHQRRDKTGQLTGPVFFGGQSCISRLKCCAMSAVVRRISAQHYTLACWHSSLLSHLHTIQWMTNVFINVFMSPHL